MISPETIGFALRALRDNKLRSGLTMLGVVIGVSAVVVAVAVGQGAASGVTNSVGQLGSNQLTIIPGAGRIGPGQVGGAATETLTVEDAEAIKKRCARTVLEVSPQVRGTLVLKTGSKTWRTSVTGSPPTFLSVNKYVLERGRGITEEDENTRSRVICLGKTVVQNLYGSRTYNCVGQEINLNRVRFRVVGILREKGASTFGQDQDDLVWTPLSTAMHRIFNQNYLSSINAQCRSPKTMDLAQEQVVQLLRRRHRLSPPFPDNDDFQILNQGQFLSTVKMIGGILTLLLAGIAAISLTVGGVGIMNIMLVSVTERTREIGIRKALGATESDIRSQFLIESALLSFIGGAVGVAFGAAVAFAAGKLSGWPITPNLLSMVVAVGVAAAIGMFFGFWPARRAAALHPIEALRRE